MSRSSSGFSFHPRSKFDAYLEGQLSPAAASRMRAHLAACTRCAEEVEQRSSALSITQRLDRIAQQDQTPHNQYFGHYTPHEPPVMKPSGLPGWKFFTSVSIVGIVVVGLFASLWVLGGEQRSFDSIDSKSPTLIPDDIEVAQADPQELIQPTPSDDSTKIPNDFGASKAQLSFSSAPLGFDGTPVRLNSLSELRSAGWTIPKFESLGLAFESAVVDEVDGQVYVVSLFNGSADDAGDQTVVRECRAEQADGSATACNRLDFTNSAATEISLPVAQNVWLYTYPDGSWTAYMATSKSQYRVDSTSDSDYAGGIMSTLYVEEESRLTTGSSDLREGMSQRFERGVERLLGQ